ncbi:MAG TPA: 2-phosphosulfolactate phosphatase [candidate division Zixibacteria bacterium]|nr:2-phosphosulfolactate phosphatase [candidate division Zixibacteria bacterium]MDD4918293.1 2-phosphosulfolactate phosphatase [candidate division Zixibacteria bacterium]MDM7973192.1 2-phosphosulfolactate phosphatase [candidate division Zixibacteria bacterium]HOD66785.1 2-phosphosulfolactate phosphatase [candidate division Zixibacteria bacterium]HPM38372.1 2-phosphosulfolactate phosphatase [candidate division Zixibacteria bacterium]
MQVDLYLTPIPFGRAKLSGRTVVAIDVLRSSTSTCAALLAGAKGVIPTPGPGEAGELWAKLGGDMAVLAGERDNVRIENFKLGNSPAEFTPETVGGKFVIMTTTNGTGVYRDAVGADLVLCCALVNVSAVARKAAAAGHGLVLVCSGQEGGFSIEDTICAGMLVHLLATEHKLNLALNDAGSLALLLYRSNKSALKKTIQQGEHGRRLTELGFGADVETAAAVDTMPVLPVMVDGRLVADVDPPAAPPAEPA